MPAHFNSQPHEEADQSHLFTGTVNYISTHSLTRRLTDCCCRVVLRCDISTHSLTRRLTRGRCWHRSTLIFQLTASRGGWPYFFTYVAIFLIFQLTASRGGWLGYMHLKNRSGIFQLTASRGGWQYTSFCRNLVIVFQLTASRGGWRWKDMNLRVYNAISTHSLTRRLTLSFIKGNQCRIFQLTASRGGWRHSPLQWFRHLHFNSQPHEEADDKLLRHLLWSQHFNSQPHEEADLSCLWKIIRH